MNQPGASAAGAADAAMCTVRVWDLPTRLFHWLLALTVVGWVVLPVLAVLAGAMAAWVMRLGG